MSTAPGITSSSPAISNERSGGEDEPNGEEKARINALR
jgi:hypothetical protein